jgi:hypothetical protein
VSGRHACVRLHWLSHGCKDAHAKHAKHNNRSNPLAYKRYNLHTHKLRLTQARTTQQAPRRKHQVPCAHIEDTWLCGSICEYHALVRISTCAGERGTWTSFTTPRSLTGLPLPSKSSTALVCNALRPRPVCIKVFSVLQGAAAVSATPAATVLSRGRDQEEESQRLQVSLLLGPSDQRSCVHMRCVCVFVRAYAAADSGDSPNSQILQHTAHRVATPIIEILQIFTCLQK